MSTAPLLDIAGLRGGYAIASPASAELLEARRDHLLTLTHR